MNDRPNPPERFLISAISATLVGGLRPAWFVMRNRMGIRQTALIPLIISGALYGAVFSALSLTSAVNAKVIALYVVLIAVGYIRNAIQAHRRRKTRDWSVHTWSSGESLLIPLMVFASSRVYRRWGGRPFFDHILAAVLTDDFVYYFAEPFTLALVALALWSIGSTLFFYPLLIAVSSIIVRNDAKLWIYLKASEIPDGQKLEQTVKMELEGPAKDKEQNVSVARVPGMPGVSLAADDASIFERLSPELQALLRKDRAADF